jgi:hypothetical protein
MMLTPSFYRRGELPAEDFARMHLEADVIRGDGAAVGLAQVVDFDDEGA